MTKKGMKVLLADLVFDPTLALQFLQGLTPKPHHAHPSDKADKAYVGPFACD